MDGIAVGPRLPGIAHNVDFDASSQQGAAQRIVRDPAGRWVIHGERLDDDGVIHEFVEFTADALFLCAGSPNTTKLLVRAAGRNDIPDLPDDVGAWWSTNGDLITSQVLNTPMGTFQGGPANVASYDWDHPGGPLTVIFAGLPLPFDANVMQTIGMTDPPPALAPTGGDQ